MKKIIFSCPQDIFSLNFFSYQEKEATNSLLFTGYTSLNSLPLQGKEVARGFTLVELIVVITILAILGTIAFISLQGYSSNSRDSVRISDLSNIDLQLELYLIKGTKLPIPDDAVILESNSVIVGYQGYIGEKKLNTIGVHGGGKDPLDDSYYTYRINGNQTTYQVMGFLENEQPLSGIFSTVKQHQGPSQEKEATAFLPQTFAVDLTKRYPVTKGKTIGILLDQTTNKPLQQIQTGVVDLRNNTTNIDMYLSTTSIIQGTPKTLYGTMETLALNQNFTEPKECPTGFIPVPGNRDLGQPAFCVAKYEMSYHGLQQTDNSLDRNTYSYLDNAGTKPSTGSIVSEQGNSPIAEITQLQAIAECEAMGKGYHLITNNEWMTIARNIEQQGTNWSSGIVGNGFIYNGFSHDLTMGCASNLSTNLPTASKRATITGDTNCTEQKNKLILSNREEIWDLSGNLQEHVNGANTLDGSNYNTMQAQSCGRTDEIWAWNSFSGNDGTPECNFGNGYSYSNIGPLTSNLNANNGIGRIWNYGGSLTNRVFLRGGRATINSSAGVFALFLDWGSISNLRNIGFRCSL